MEDTTKINLDALIDRVRSESENCTAYTGVSVSALSVKLINGILNKDITPKEAAEYLEDAYNVSEDGWKKCVLSDASVGQSNPDPATRKAFEGLVRDTMAVQEMVRERTMYEIKQMKSRK